MLLSHDWHTTVDATRPQVFPKNPDRQSQEKVPSSLLLHWPPFRQGNASHGRISWLVVEDNGEVVVVVVVVVVDVWPQSSPVHPEGQLHTN